MPREIDLLERLDRHAALGRTLPANSIPNTSNEAHLEIVKAINELRRQLDNHKPAD